MLGPSPFKRRPPNTKDTKPPILSVGDVIVPTEEINKIKSPEFIGLGESPSIDIPSTLDQILVNEELLDDPTLVAENAVTIFPNVNSIKDVAFGIPTPDQVDSGAFGGGFGTQTQSQEQTVVSGPLDRDESSLLIQNTLLVPLVATGEMIFQELGTKLKYSTEQSNKLNSILSTQFPLLNLDTQVVVDPPTFLSPDPPFVLDGGEF
jgi:hypothetical protein